MISKGNKEQSRSTHSQQETPVPLNDEPLLCSKFINPSPPIHCVPPSPECSSSKGSTHGKTTAAPFKKCCYIKCLIGLIKLWRYYSSNLSGAPVERTVATGYLHLQFYLYWAIKSSFIAKYLSHVSSVLRCTKWDWNIESVKRGVLSSLDFHSETPTRRAFFYYSSVRDTTWK